VTDAQITQSAMTSFDKRRPRDPDAFARMLAAAAVAIDRARAGQDAGVRRAALPPAAADEPANPYDLLQQASRAQERAAAQLLAARARPPRK
jgi:hypothetical protein